MALYKAQFAKEVEAIEIHSVSFEADSPEQALDILMSGDFKTHLITQRNYTLSELVPESVKWLKQ